MQPQNNVTMAPGVPLVDLKIDGLAVCCFNKKVAGAFKWEVAFLRFKDHEMEITVDKGASDDKIPVPMGVDRLNFMIDKPSQAAYQLFTEGYFTFPVEFSRKDLLIDAFGLPVDSDFRWAIDFKDSNIGHGNVVKLIKKKEQDNRVGVTLTTIPGALFYTETVAESPVIFSPRKKNNPNHGIVFGPTSGIIGAVIFAEAGGDVKIVDPEGNMDPIVLPYVAGRVHQVSIKNMDKQKKLNAMARGAKANYVKGDFHRYYDVIKVDGEEQEMWAPAKDDPGRGRLGDCHAVMIGLDTLEPLTE